MMRYRFPLLVVFGMLFAAVLVSGCSGVQAKSTGQIQVVASTTLVGDVVKNIGGDHIALSVLIPVNVDEHAYEPKPQDMVKVNQASLVFLNGAGLEPFADRLTKNAGKQTRLIAVSDGILLIKSPADEQDPDHSAGDPHVWTDPNNVVIWVKNIESALSAADPQHAADYQKNANVYRQQLMDLDAWIKQQVEIVPPERRKLVTDHLVFTYFSDRYGFNQVGAVIPGYSTGASPSAQELAALEKSIRDLHVPVVFVGNTVSPVLAERVAQDTQIRLVQILTGSLTAAGGPASSYLDYMRYNVNTIVTALK